MINMIKSFELVCFCHRGVCTHERNINNINLNGLFVRISRFPTELTRMSKIIY